VKIAKQPWIFAGLLLAVITAGAPGQQPTDQGLAVSTDAVADRFVAAHGQRALLMGYSMGARISMGLLARYPKRFRAVVLGGIGAGAGVTDPAARKPIVAALLAYDKSKLTDQRASLLREFAEANKNDLKALAACMAADRETIAPSQFTNNRVPVLVVVGTKDELVGRPEDLVIMIPRAQLLKLEGRDHLNAPGDKLYQQAVVKFFEGAPT